MKIFLTGILIISFNFLIAQTSDKDFERFANQQDSLMTLAYGKLDTSSFNKCLNLFLIKYNSLDDKNKKQYENYLIGAYYNLACTYALNGNKEKALFYLEKSKYPDYRHMLGDTDLDIIRNDARFKKCLNYAKVTGPDHLGILKKGALYNPADKIMPEFTYQSAKDSSLVLLKKLYNLDSIAGQGNDISKVISLMRWVHNIISHDGVTGADCDRNALAMISLSKKNKISLNCRGLAIVLNEVYLAMNFKSRFVTCLPKDSTDNYCHVINVVYVPSLKKWVWMDPTFEAYVSNEKGELLSIQEVRERLITDKPLLLNPDANWNHKTSQSKEGYLQSYMAKNLYRLQCPVSSEFNYESRPGRKENKYCELTPLDYDNYNKQNIKISALIKSNYRSYNDKLFWKP